MEKIRLDLYLTLNNYVSSRNKACQLIKNNNVMVNDKIVSTNSYLVKDSDIVKIIDDKVLNYVSRGGLKLQKALVYFKVDLTGLVVLDIGASTGGFSDCAIKHQAKLVYALDVGENQLDSRLRNNDKIISLENTNFKDVTKEMFKHKIDFYVCDVSFISITTILLKLQEFDDNFNIILLYKPQFEVGRANLNKHGLVKSNKILKDNLKIFIDFLRFHDIGLIDATYSPITGNKQGNIEFLFYLKNKAKSNYVDVDKLVNEANKELRNKDD